MYMCIMYTCIRKHVYVYIYIYIYVYPEPETATLSLKTVRFQAAADPTEAAIETAAEAAAVAAARIQAT